MIRSRIYDVIDNERTYQDIRWASDDHKHHEVEAFILYMEHYITEARRTITKGGSLSIPLESLRKVVALGIACFEQHGVPDRIVDEV